MKIGPDCGGELLERLAAEIGQACGCMGYKGWLVSFSPMRNWRQIGRIGFNEDSVQRRQLCCGLQIRRFRIGHNAGKTEIEPHGQSLLCLVGAPRKAMQYAR